MPTPMNKEEIEITINRMRDQNNATHEAHYDRVIDHMCNYINANIEDFMGCYEDVADDEDLYDIHLKRDDTKHLQDNIQAYFADSKTCYGDLGLARKAFGNGNTTEDEYDQMEKSLGLMYLYCPEDMQSIVHATMLEATQRKFYFEKRWSAANNS